MDCGIPFCHGTGCPVKNRIPEFNDLVHRGQWQAASENLHSTNNFPEVTGRVCPAPCEAACTLTINDRAVNIKHIEFQIAERAFQEGWVEPICLRRGRASAWRLSGPALPAWPPPSRSIDAVTRPSSSKRTTASAACCATAFPISSSKSGSSTAAGTDVGEGVRFQPGVDIGRDMTAAELRGQFDAVCLCMGAGQARPLSVTGSELRGVHLAMEFLSQQNRRVAGDDTPAGKGPVLTAKGKHVIVVGGGDTGSDCVGTSIRQGAISVTQLEILPKPPEGRNDETPWPQWPRSCAHLPRKKKAANGGGAC